jgi:DNA repair exonuclease SbcCD ATPase subunit
MFAKSFPIWIIDEGTNHLSETNRVKYFELINALRKQKVIDQIIVIDHDERLKDVVDQIIEM